MVRKLRVSFEPSPVAAAVESLRAVLSSDGTPPGMEALAAQVAQQSARVVEVNRRLESLTRGLEDVPGFEESSVEDWEEYAEDLPGVDGAWDELVAGDVLVDLGGVSRNGSAVQGLRALREILRVVEDCPFVVVDCQRGRSPCSVAEVRREVDQACRARNVASDQKQESGHRRPGAPGAGPRGGRGPQGGSFGGLGQEEWERASRPPPGCDDDETDTPRDEDGLPAPARDFLERAGLGWPCARDDLRRAFRALAKRTHPDHDHSRGAHDRFIRLQAGYRCLLDLAGDEAA
jgi:hypothetical protein